MKNLLVLSVVALMLQSCATIMSGSKQSVSFNSDPPDATVYIGHYKNKQDIYNLNKEKAVAIGKTPMTAEIKRKTKLIFISKEGYNDTIIYFANKTYKAKYVDPKTNFVTVKKVQPAKYYSHVNPWYFGDLPFLLLGGLGYAIAVDIDLISGAFYKLDSPMTVKLEKKK